MKGFSERIPEVAILLALGVLSSITAIITAYLPVKFATLIPLALALALWMVVVDSSLRIISLCFLMAFFNPVNLDINFFLHKHVGGASSISISMAWLSALGLLLLSVARKKKIIFGKELVPIFLYMLCGALSLINADYPEFVFLEIVRLIMLSLVVVAIVNISERDILDKFLVFIAVAVVFQAILAILQFSLKNFPSVEIIGIKTLKDVFPGQKVHRAMGTLGHPNFLGYYLEMTIPLVFGAFLTSRVPFLKIFLGFVFALGTIALIFSKSRGAWIGYPISIVGTLLLIYGRDLLKKGIFVKALVVSFTFFSLIVAFSPTIKDRLVGKDYRAIYVRSPLNKASLSIMAQFPVVGVGMNNFSEVFKKYDTTGHSKIFRGFKHVVHNMYLLVATETGILGLLAFLSIFLVPFYHVIRSFAITEDHVLRAPVAGALMGLFAHLIHGLVDPGFIVSSSGSFTVFLLIGLIGAYYRFIVSSVGNSR